MSDARPTYLLIGAAAVSLAAAPAFAQHEEHAPAAPAAPAAAEPTDHAAHAEHAEHAQAPAQPAAGPAPPVTDADRAAAFPDLSGMRMHDMMLEDPLNKLVLLDRVEVHDASGHPLAWNLDAWLGHDLRKLWVRSEGKRRRGATERAELELLYGRSFARWWDVLAGVRHDFEPGTSQDWAAVGVRGLAPYRLEIEATAYVGNGSRTAFRFETQYDVLVTNRLILQPQLELNWRGQSDVTRRLGSGLTDGELGLRLRYELRREVAPYVGLVRERSFGRTASLTRATGGNADDTRLVAGVRVWF
jgi:copper resistance protein B